MSQAFNRELTEQRHRLLNEEELIQIAHTHAENYLPEVVAMARAELARRGFDQAPEAFIAERAAQHQADRDAIAQAPLSLGWKLATGIAPVLIGLIIYLALRSGGQRRAARDAGWWIAYGVLFKAGMLAIFLAAFWFAR